MIKLIAVDMDGTFLNDQGTYDTMRFTKIYEKIRAQKIHFVVASGSQLYRIQDCFPKIKDEIGYVAENGAFVVAGNKELFSGAMNMDVLQRIYTEILENPHIHAIICGKKSAYVLQNETLDFKQNAINYYHKLSEVPNFDNIQDMIFKVALLVENTPFSEYHRHLKHTFKDEVTAVVSGNGYIDLIIPGLHKANGLKILQKHWQISEKEILAFGDNDNDLEMLDHVGMGYVMQNAKKDMRKHANNIAPSNNESGVLQIIEKLLNI